MSDNNQALAATLPEKVIQHVAVTSAALEKAAAAETAQVAKQASVEALIPAACEAMIRHDRIMPTQREKLAEMLKDPVKTLELLTKVAGHRNADEIARLGAGIDPNAREKAAGAQAPYDSLTDPHVGARTTRVKLSSDKLFRGLGLDPPTE